MYLLRHSSFSKLLKFYRSDSLFRGHYLSFPFASFHCNEDNQTKLNNNPINCLHNKNPLNFTRRRHISLHRVIIHNKRLLSNVRNSIDPYVRLIRFDRPIGSWLLFWPCGWSIALSATAGELPDLKLLTLFGIGALVMRGAGCTINDLWDKDIDAQVERTKNRPLVTNEIKPLDAWIFLSGQLSLGLTILLQLNWTSIVIGACSLGLVTVYPLMKRITYWPQLVLGMTFNYGALLGWCATQGSIYLPACLPLYIAGISWTIVYDTIYAHQDKVDDVIIGIKSTALRFGDNTKVWLAAFSTTMLSGLLTSGYVCDQTWPYYVSIGLVGAHLARQCFSLKINDPGDCARKFISNYQVGFIIFIGIIIGNCIKSKQEVKATPNLQPTSTYIDMTNKKLHLT